MDVRTITPIIGIILLSFFLETYAQPTGLDTIFKNGSFDSRIDLVFLGDGYTIDQQQKFRDDAIAATNYFFEREPFKSYKDFFNVYSIGALSVDSGASHPCNAPGENPPDDNNGVPCGMKDTWYGASFDGGPQPGEHHVALVITKPNRVIQALNTWLPQRDEVFVLINTPYHGGVGNFPPTANVSPSGSYSTALHEFGHYFANLADEYTASGGTGNETQANVTMVTDSNLLKWKHWVTPGTAIPTCTNADPPDCYVNKQNVVGLFEGAAGQTSGWYRPRIACVMFAADDFCEVCREQVALTIHKETMMIQYMEPPAAKVSMAPGDWKYFRTNLIANNSMLTPDPSTLKHQWVLNTNVVGSTSSSYLFYTDPTYNCAYKIVGKVLDTTFMVRKTTPVDSVIWYVYPDSFGIPYESREVCLYDSVLLSAWGGTAYTWSPATGLSDPNIANPKASPVVNTSYTVTITDSCGVAHVAVDTVLVIVKPLPVADAGRDTSVCYDTEKIISGSGAGTCIWSPATGLSSQNSCLTKVRITAPQTYILTVIDNNGCRDKDTVEVSVDPLPVADAGEDVSICLGDSVAINVTGAPDCQFSAGFGLSDQSSCNPKASPPVTFSYEVIITDQNECRDRDTITITVNPLPVAHAGLDVNLCSGESTSLSGGSGGSCTWAPAAGLDDPTFCQPLASPSSTTEYTLTITDANGCEDMDTLEIFVDQSPKLPVADAGLDQEICLGDYVVLNAACAHTCSWSPAAGLSDPNICNPVASPSYTTEYTLTITNPDMSQSVDQVTVTVFSLPDADAGPNVAICEGGSTTLEATGGTTCNWEPSYFLSDPGICNPVANPPADITYTVTVTDDNGCKNNDDVDVIVTPNPPPVQIGELPGVYLGYNDCVDLQATIGANLPYEDIVWNTGDTATAITICPDSTFELSVQLSLTTEWEPVQSGSGDQDVVVRPEPVDEGGENTCHSTDQVTVTVIDVRCGKNNDKVLLCHQVQNSSNSSEESSSGSGSASASASADNSSSDDSSHDNNSSGSDEAEVIFKTKCVPAHKVEKHLAHGDQLGPCGNFKAITDNFTEEVYSNDAVYFRIIPNPFARQTEIRFMVDREEEVRVKIFNIMGAEVAELFHGTVQASVPYSITFNADFLPKGLFLCHLYDGSGNLLHREKMIRVE